MDVKIKSAPVCHFVVREIMILLLIECFVV